MGRYQPAERPESDTPHSQPVLSAEKNRAAGAHDPLERVAENILRDAAQDAFLAFWRGAADDQARLWAAYCDAQERYDAYVVVRP